MVAWRFAAWTAVRNGGGRPTRPAHMIHIVAMSQIRLDTDGRAYYRRKRVEGKKSLEAIRCLKAQDLRRDLPPASRGRTTCRWPRPWHGSGRAPRGVSRIQRGRPAPAHRHFGSATSRTREQDAMPGAAGSEGPARQRPQTSRLKTEGSRYDALSATATTSSPLVLMSFRVAHC